MRLLLVALIIPLRLLATEYFVAPDGLDTNPGTEALPWRTIQKAANTLQPGDTAFVKQGVPVTPYNETVTVNVSGSAAAGFVTIRNFPGELPVIDRTGTQPPSNAITGLFLVEGKSHVRIDGFELRNYKATNSTNNQLKVPSGVMIRGASDHIEIRNCKVHDIWNHFADGNAFGIAVYGDSATPMTRIVIDGNEVSQCRTGNSETIVVNGNVVDFEITNNLVHDNTNIGIDAIGYEGTCPDPTQDRARGGVIRGNTVWNCSSAGTTGTGVPSNPAYGGDPGAGGIYVDGGTNILIERNTTYQNDIGIELASEHAGKATDFVTVRNNFVWRNKIGGIFMGGSGAGNGSAERNAVRNNTLWENDTNNDGNGEIQFQFWCHDNTVTGNIAIAGAQALLFSNPAPATSGGNPTNTGNVIDWNCWFAPVGAAASEWQWKNANKTSYATWRTASGQDANSQFTDPRLVDATLAAVAPPAAPDLHLRLDSPAIDAGDPAHILAGDERDIDGALRITGARVDQGADELARRDAWRVEKFGAHATAAVADFDANPDGDLLPNLLEYALGTEPLFWDANGLPAASTAAYGAHEFLALTFTKSLLADDLTFVVQIGAAPGDWSDGSTYGPNGDMPSNLRTSEISRTTIGENETIVVRDNTPIGSGSRVMRLRVLAE